MSTSLQRHCAAAALLLSACEGDTIIPSRDWLRPNTLDFGSQPIGARYSERVTLTNASSEEARVQEVRFEPDVAAYTARTQRNDTLTGQALNPSRSLDFLVHFDPIDLRRYDTTMFISIGEDEIPLAITAEGILEPLSLELRPSVIDFAGVPLGSRASVNLEVENTGGRMVQLTEVLVGGTPLPDRIDGTSFYVSRAQSQAPLRNYTLGPRSVHVFSVHFAPMDEVRTQSNIELRFESGESVVIPVSGTGFRRGSISCVPMSHDFGQLPRGQVARVSVSCRASGGSAGFSALSFAPGSADQFAVYGPPAAGATIGDGQSVSFELGFSALGTPAFQQAVFVMEEIGGGTSHTISLRGEVVPPGPAETDISVQLTWDTPDTDFDLHLVRGDRQPFDGVHDCYFAQKNPNWGVVGESLDDPYLDRDDTSGFGPELANLVAAQESRYNVYVHFYRAPVGGRPSVASVSVNLLGQLAAQPSQTLNTCGDLWHVGRIDISAAAGSSLFTAGGVITSLVSAAGCP